MAWAGPATSRSDRKRGRWSSKAPGRGALIGRTVPDPSSPLFAADVVDEVVVVRGEVDLATVGAFQEALEDAAATGPLHVDLRGVSYLDSAGIASLFAYVGDGLELTAVRDSIVHRVLDIAGLLTAARVHLVPEAAEDPSTARPN